MSLKEMFENGGMVLLSEKEEVEFNGGCGGASGSFIDTIRRAANAKFTTDIVLQSTANPVPMSSSNPYSAGMSGCGNPQATAFAQECYNGFLDNWKKSLSSGHSGSSGSR